MFNEHIQNIVNRIFPVPNISRVFPAQIKFNYASQIININHIENELDPTLSMFHHQAKSKTTFKSS